MGEGFHLTILGLSNGLAGALAPLMAGPANSYKLSRKKGVETHGRFQITVNHGAY